MKGFFTGFVIATAALLLPGCEAEFNRAKVLTGPVVLDCINGPDKQRCIDQSVILTGFVFARDSDGYRVNFNNPLSGYSKDRDFKVELVQGIDHGMMQGKVRISGVIIDDGFYTKIRGYAIEPAPLSPSEARARAARIGDASRQKSLATIREEGARALDEADTVIRQNSAAMRRELESKAVMHRTSSSGDLRIDVYGMRDGRLIACKTVIYGTGAPIMSCDGEP